MATVHTEPDRHRDVPPGHNCQVPDIKMKCGGTVTEAEKSELYPKRPSIISALQSPDWNNGAPRFLIFERPGTLEIQKPCDSARRYWRPS